MVFGRALQQRLALGPLADEAALLRLQAPDSIHVTLGTAAAAGMQNYMQTSVGTMSQHVTVIMSWQS
jgi:hypothetical protein